MSNKRLNPTYSGSVSGKNALLEGRGGLPHDPWGVLGQAGVIIC